VAYRALNGMAARAAIGLREGTSDPVEKQEWEHELMLRVKARPPLPRSRAWATPRADPAASSVDAS
jgi:hypothetical protein